MTEQEFKKTINFRTIDAPCCGNCKWFNVDYGITFCKNADNTWEYEDSPMPTDDDCPFYVGKVKEPLQGIQRNQVCDRFERREESHNA